MVVRKAVRPDNGAELSELLEERLGMGNRGNGGQVGAVQHTQRECLTGSRASELAWAEISRRHPNLRRRVGEGAPDIFHRRSVGGLAGDDYQVGAPGRSERL